MLLPLSSTSTTRTPPFLSPKTPTTTTKPFTSLPKLKLSLHENLTTTTPPKTSKKSVWINPNSPKNPQNLSKLPSPQNTFLANLAASLDISPPDSISTLLSELPPSKTHHSSVVILDLMQNPVNAVIVLDCLRKTTQLEKQVILYNVTFKVLRKAKNWDAVVSLWDDMLRNGVQPDNVTFSTIISCARQCDLPEKAVEWFEKMGEFGCVPDVVTYSVMIDAYGRAGNAEMGLRLYERAREEKWRLDSITFAAAVRVYSVSGNYDGALGVYEEMKGMGVKPNLAVYNTLFDAMGRAGRPWQVKTLYKDLMSGGLVPNRATYAALLRAYSKARYAEDALSIYAEMKKKGMDMNVILYNMLLSMCADIGLVDEAVAIFNEMKSSRGVCKPDSWSYSSLITAYSCSGKVLEAEKMLDEMLEAGFQPNIFVLTSLIQCYGKARQVDSVVRAFDKLSEMGIVPDDRFCGCLLNVATLTPKDELNKIVGCIERANSQLGSLVNLLIDEETAHEVVRKDAEELLKNVSNEVRKAYCNCWIDLCVKLNQLERASVLLDMGLHLGIYRDLQSKSDAQWSLHVKSLSHGAALTALHVWMSDLSAVLQNGGDLPPLLGIHTGHGKHKYSEKGLASAFQSRLRELNAPFHEAPDKIGWFLTTKVAAVSWLESRNSAELVAA